MTGSDLVRMIGQEFLSGLNPLKQSMSENKNILIVEDDAVGQIVIAGMLKNFGYGADIVANGHRALEYLAKKEYRLIFMDCLMPGMDGFQTTAKIREMEGNQNRAHKATIVALTARALSGDREKCLAAGMDEYLAKPLEMKELKAVLKKHLESH